MKMNPQKVNALLKHCSSNLVTKSRELLRRFEAETPQDATDLTIYDESSSSRVAFGCAIPGL